MVGEKKLLQRAVILDKWAFFFLSGFGLGLKMWVWEI
jgi:uncharacterized protein YgfB (UPF0149 family)